MASFHLAVKTIGRSVGRSATAAAAYRAGVEIADERTGIVHDYTRKQGIEHREIVAPADAPGMGARPGGAVERCRAGRDAQELDGRAGV